MRYLLFLLWLSGAAAWAQTPIVPPQQSVASVTSNATLDASQYNVYRVGNAANDVILTIDVAKMMINQTLLIKRDVALSSGTITLVTSNSATNLIQNADGTLVSSTTVPSWANGGMVQYFWTGTNLELVSSSPRKNATVTIVNAAASGAITVDCSQSSKIILLYTLTGNVTLTFTNVTPGVELYIREKQGGAGGFAITLPSSVTFPGGAAIDRGTAAGSVTTFSLFAANATEIDGYYTKF
ncbi:hypothetical protein FAES_3235 [Fibrella aestuarina BUZ 2]|uniref:Auto-transporter adhesin head GIN domain-containing protein n=1 Tax=Fibrella aestuarina BUZ 2 TaxID=1166018 RepID=I0KAU1_9BACT|nr:hypothetical protein [Fibrella aestuarina]CCH01244.1 hypothetical protein FAES_3235 [Fibrella aestuarina BUZ 2]